MYAESENLALMYRSGKQARCICTSSSPPSSALSSGCVQLGVPVLRSASLISILPVILIFYKSFKVEIVLTLSVRVMMVVIYSSSVKENKGSSAVIKSHGPPCCWWWPVLIFLVKSSLDNASHAKGSPWKAFVSSTSPRLTVQCVNRNCH